MKKRIHVNQFKIKSNAKHNKNEPVLTIKTYKDNWRLKFDVNDS